MRRTSRGHGLRGRGTARPTRFGETRKNAFGPRLGIAYQLNSKTVIRTGGAIFYQPIREDGNADNGIQGFGGTFGATANFLSNGVSFLTKNGVTAVCSAADPEAEAADQGSTQTFTTNLFQQSPFYYFAGPAGHHTSRTGSSDRAHHHGQASVFRATYHGVVGNKLISRLQSNQLGPEVLVHLRQPSGNTDQLR